MSQQCLRALRSAGPDGLAVVMHVSSITPGLERAHVDCNIPYIVDLFYYDDVLHRTNQRRIILTHFPVAYVRLRFKSCSIHDDSKIIWVEGSWYVEGFARATMSMGK